jgi:tetratricopeptide (TPR) repeat protein/TolB-like protein
MAFVLLLSLGGCTGPQSNPAYVKNGKAYGIVKGAFRHRWWNFYERGLSFAEGQFYEEAVLDLKTAIKQRDKDQRSARSYGMHFVDYFPHRELGVIYFHMGKYEEAEKELETSLSTVDTGKTKHYLNMVRKVLLEASNADTAPPTINLVSVFGGEITNRLKLELKGEVEDDAYAHKIAINDVPQFIELSAKKIPFSKEIKLKKGLNEIKIKTSDLLGKVTEKKVKVVGDFEGPAFNIQNYADGQEVDQNKVVLNGAMADATGITTLKINDKVLAYNKEREIEFAFAVDLTKGKNKIQLAATDVAGNTTTGELNLTYVPKLAKEKPYFKDSPVDTHDLKKPMLLAFSGTVVSDDGHGFLYSAANPSKPEAAFRLNFKDLIDTQTVYYGTMFIDGSATGTNEIKSVTINGSPLLIIPGRTVYFNQLMELKEGENKLTIEVMDAKGNKASKTVTVIRKIHKVRQLGSRMSLAIMPFVMKGEASMASSFVYDNLMNAFINQNRFHIVARGDELEAVLREQKLSQTDLIDKSTAVRVGKLVAAEGIVMGTVHETKDFIEIFARLVNTETSTVLEAKDVFGQDKSISQIQYLTNGLALKLKHSFPLIEGLVIKTKGKDIYADFGSFKRIKKEMKFIVFRQGESIVHPVTGKVLGSDTEELGVATVVTVFEDMSIGKLVAEFDPSKVHVKDLIITK